MTWKSSLKEKLPVLLWVPQYTVKRYIVKDLLAGLTLAAFAVPQAFAFGVVANLPPEFSLYTTLIPPIVYFLFGTSPYMAVGPSTLVAHVIGSTVGSIAEWFNKDPNFPDALKFSPGNNSRSFKTYRDVGPSIAFFVSFVSAIFLLLIYITRLRKWMRFILPPSLVSAFTSAVALLIISSQLNFFFGLKLPGISKTFAFVERFIALFKGIRQISIPTFIVGLSSLVMIALAILIEDFIVRRRDNKSQQENPDASSAVDQRNRTAATVFRSNVFPSSLVVLIMFSLLSYFLDFEGRQIETVGPVPAGLPSFAVPWAILFDIPSQKIGSFIGTVLWKGLSVALVVHASTLAVIHTFTSSTPLGVTQQERALYELFVIDEDRQDQDDQELLALSVCGIVGSFFSCFAPASSLGKAGLLYTQTEVQSPFANLMTVLIIVPLLLFATGALSYIPLASLAALMCVSLFPMVALVRDAAEYFKMACLYEENRLENRTLVSEDDHDDDVEMAYVRRSPVVVAVAPTSPPLEGGRPVHAPAQVMTTRARQDNVLPSTATTCLTRLRQFLLRLLRLGHIWKHFVIWLITFILVLLLDIATGLLCGIGVTIMLNCVTLLFRRMQ